MNPEFFAKFKRWMSRGRWYLSMLQFAMITYLTIEKGINPLFLIAGVLLFIPLMFLDIKYFLGQEHSYVYKKNPEWRGLRRDVSYIKNKIDEKDSP